MVWPFSASVPSTGVSPPSQTNDGGFTAPDRSTREKCYHSRDTLFDCLDQHAILDALKEDDKSRRLCGKQNEAYDRDCARAWIKYFKEKRVMEYNRDQTIQRIKSDDAAMVARQKKEKEKKGGWGVFG